MNKLLIANRGEIAVRVIRTAQQLGYATVAVFSDADADAPHVQLADQAVRLGPAPATESYLSADRLLAAARQTGADAVHPGYGFLSENPEFAQQVIDAGLTWIGPSPSAMEIMGNKSAAKAAVADSPVPLIPGYSGDDQSDAAFVAAAEDSGYPVMIKAAAGGGGRGMRLVTGPEELTEALSSARSESLKAFGSDALLLEKAIVSPRHVEFQIFADQHGNTIHLGERDCSIQRRHQKVVEEAPSPSVTHELRERMGQAAVAAAEAVQYTNAGTVEFLLDQDDEFYFIEMNTRLQVEHPVTELITGFDLVEWQLRVAEGMPLPVSQDDINLRGHAIEVRLYAESPENEFLPSTGTVLHWAPPAGEGIRVDHGLRSGQVITPFYDAMIAKVMTYGSDRESARRRLQRALEQTIALGVDTNRGFLLDTVRHPDFAAGSATTSFIEQTYQPEPVTASSQLITLAAALFYHRSQSRGPQNAHRWNAPTATFRLCSGAGETVVHVDSGAAELSISSESFGCHLQILSVNDHQLCFEMNGLRDSAAFVWGQDDCLWIQYGDETVTFTDRLLAPASSVSLQASGSILAPMPGAVLRLDVVAGDTVEPGQSLFVLEAMKMEQTVTAELNGTVSEVLVSEGQQVTPRQLMITIEPLSDS